MKKEIDKFILLWVEENIESGKKISELIISIGFSRKTIETWFRHEHGISLGKYLYRRRMTRISVLLRYTHLAITEIAELFHYSSTQNFSRAFKKHTGKTPKNYRNDILWNCSSLQYPLFKNGQFDPQIKYCHLPNMYIRGETKVIKEFLYNSTEVFNNCFQKVEEITSKGINEVYMICCTDKSNTLSDCRNGFISVMLTIGALSHSIHKESVKISSGNYIYYEFSGGWDDYLYYSRYYHIKLMSENNIDFEERQHITKFKKKISSHEYDFTIYIPIFMNEYQLANLK